MSLLRLEDFAQLIIEVQSTDSDTSYSTWEFLSRFIKENFDTFLTYFISILESSDYPLNSKKITLILFDQLFKDDSNNLPIAPDIFPSLIEVNLSMFQLNDIELTGLSAKLTYSLVLPELLDEDEEESGSELMNLLIKHFSTVENASEIYGFSTILYEICRTVKISHLEQEMIIQGIQNHLISNSNSIDSFIKIKILKILNSQIDKSMEEPTLQTILQLLVQIIDDIELHSEIFSCFSSIITSFPSYTDSIFKNLVPIAIESLNQNEDNYQSLLYFFNTLISKDTIQYYQEIIPVLIPFLFSILENEVDIFESEVDNYKSEVSDLIENIFRIYDGDIIELVQEQQNKNNLAFLLAFCVLSKKGEVNFPFVFSMINSKNPRERYMAIRCVKKLIKSDIFNEDLISESLKHFEDDSIVVQIETIDLIGELSKNNEFPIENFFEIVLHFYMCDNYFLYFISYESLKKFIERISLEKLSLLVPLILSDFEECLSNEETYELLISLSTLIQSLSIRLGELYSPFAEQSFSLLQQMSNIDEDFLVSSLTPIASIAYNTKFMPFLDEFCVTMLNALQSFCESHQAKNEEENEEEDKFDEDYNEVVEGMIDAVLISLCFMMKEFDLRGIAPDFLITFFGLFEITGYLKIFGGFSDILSNYPEFTKVVGEQLFQLIISSSKKLFSFINSEEEDEDEEEDFDDDDDYEKSEALHILSDVLNLIKILTVEFDIDQPFVEFVFQLIEASEKFAKKSETLNFVLLTIICEFSKKVPNETFEFIQSHNATKEAVLFGLNDTETHQVSQNIIDIFGAENF